MSSRHPPVGTSGRTFSLKNLSGSLHSRASVDPIEVARTRTAALQFASRKIEDFTHVDFKTVLQDLASNPLVGLTKEEAKMRLERHGPNELDKDDPVPLWRLFLEQFTDILVILLMIASVVSMVLSQFVAGAFIIIIVLLNAYIGAIQEYKASGSLQALQQMTADEATVIRDGKEEKLVVFDIVPGDIVVLSNGSKVPADLRLIESHNLSSDESPLTGESAGVKKDAEFVETFEEETLDPVVPEKEKKLTSMNVVFMGCGILDGHGKGVVIKTGMDTRMGHIATMLSTTEEGASPLRERLQRLGLQLGIASIAISIVVFIVGVATNNGDILDLLLIALSLTVAAVPEGLPTAVTITLSLGMKRLLDAGALVKFLRSVETLGSASVICSDKTGTLTKGEMTAVRIWQASRVWKITGTGYSPIGSIYKLNAQGNEEGEDKSGIHCNILSAGMLCSNAKMVKSDSGEWTAVGNISERPLIVAGVKADIDPKKLSTQFSRKKENPFSSIRKMMSVLVKNDASSGMFPENSEHVAIVKGAPNIVLDHCINIQNADGSVRPLTEADRSEILCQIDAFSEKAFRVLAFSYKPHNDLENLDAADLESDLTFMGLIAAIDPERTEIIPSIQQCYQAGIRVVMITGDYVKTAKAIAENINLIPKDAPAKSAIDCAVIRQYGSELDALDEKKELSEAEELRKTQLESEIDAITASADVYARAKPEDKMTIVTSLQRQGNVCSMTGDGVNDAPALKRANIGVAMGITGTGVAKGAADMILTNDDFVSIVNAVQEGRTIYANITKFIFYLLSTNVAEVFFVLISFCIGYPTPLSPVQLLYLNLVTDGAPAVALAVEKTEEGTMLEGPRKSTESILSPLLITGICIQSVVLTALCLCVYITGLYWHVGSTDPSFFRDSANYKDDDVDKARSMTIIYIVFAELFRAYTSRSLRDSVIKVGLADNIWMFYSVFGAVGLTFFIYLVPGINDAFGFRPLDGRSWGLVLGLVLVPSILDELTKLVYRWTGYGARERIARYEFQSEMMDQDAVKVFIPNDSQEMKPFA